ncbi:MAG: extracellular solute-binding protein [Bdellovibrionales bacterium]|nr:extracellular solute-binding protein [Bdellovibrionales bacterium]
MRILLSALMLFCQFGFADINIYSDRDASWFESAVEQFRAETGENVIIVGISHKEMIQRLVTEVSEGGTPADLVISKDLLYFTELKRRGMLTSLPEVPAFAEIPQGMISEDRSWAAFTYRARAAIFKPGIVEARQLISYQDLADEKWKGKLCLRQGSSFYNIALVSSLIVQYGKEEANRIVEGWVANLAAPIQPNDRAVIAAVDEGKCQVGIINHYYLAQQMVKFPELSVEFRFLNQGEGGVHTNGTAIMKINQSDNKTAQVEAFLKALYSEASLKEISAAHYDFPASTTVNSDTFVGQWGPNKDGEFLVQGLSWDEIGAGQNRADAVAIMTDAGWL